MTNYKVDWFLSTFRKVILWGPTFFQACSVAMIAAAVNILTTLSMTSPNQGATSPLRKILYLVAMLSSVRSFAASNKMWSMVREAFIKHALPDKAWHDLIKQYEKDETPEHAHNDKEVTKTLIWWVASNFVFIAVIVLLIVN